MLEPHKTDMVAAVLDEFDLHTIAYIGEDDEFETGLAERIGDREIAAPGEDPADIVFIDEYPDVPAAAISMCLEKVKDGGFLMGSKFLHSEIPVMNAIAECFNLMLVQCGPAGVWAVRK